jgi:hypothetical protein
VLQVVEVFKHLNLFELDEQLQLELVELILAFDERLAGRLLLLHLRLELLQQVAVVLFLRLQVLLEELHLAAVFLVLMRDGRLGH